MAKKMRKQRRQRTPAGQCIVVVTSSLALLSAGLCLVGVGGRVESCLPCSVFSFLVLLVVWSSGSSLPRWSCLACVFVGLVFLIALLAAHTHTPIPPTRRMRTTRPGRPLWTIRCEGQQDQETRIWQCLGLVELLCLLCFLFVFVSSVTLWAAVVFVVFACLFACLAMLCSLFSLSRRFRLSRWSYRS